MKKLALLVVVLSILAGCATTSGSNCPIGSYLSVTTKTCKSNDLVRALPNRPGAYIQG